MTTIHLTDADLIPDANALRGTFIDARHYDRIIRDDTRVLKPDGQPLIIYMPKVLPRLLCDVVFDTYKDVIPRSDNRGMGGRRFRRIKNDGTRSRTKQAPPAP